MDFEASDVMTLTQSAALLGVSRPTIKRLIECGELSAFASSIDRRSRLIRVSDLRNLQRRSLSPFVNGSRQGVVVA